MFFDLSLNLPPELPLRDQPCVISMNNIVSLCFVHSINSHRREHIDSMNGENPLTLQLYVRLDMHTMLMMLRRLSRFLVSVLRSDDPWNN